MPSNLCYTLLTSPIGELFIRGDGDFITGLYMPPHKGFDGPTDAERPSDTAFTPIKRQLEAYFAGELQQFNVRIKVAGTAFQEEVWRQLTLIPYGTTISYAQLAHRVGRPKAVRAVGTANGRNPISIIVPCHRVIASSGALAGYGGGLARKQQLLDCERRNLK